MHKTKGPLEQLSERRMIENEVIFRRVNESVKDFIKADDDFSSQAARPFYCECSRPDCVKRIKLSPRQYEQVHANKRLFITRLGHEFPEIEKVVSKKEDFQVVEKHDAPPSPARINLALKSIKI